MALATYSDLLASVASWMNRTDLTAVIPDFVALAEGRIANDLRIRQQVTVDTLSTSTTTRSVLLPTDFLEFENISVDGTPETPLQYVTKEHMDVNYPEGGPASRPIVFTIAGDYILFGPTPDAVYTINMDYYGRFNPLSVTSSNGLLTNHPSVYLYACLREASLFVMDDARVVHWEQLYQNAVNVIQAANEQATHSGSALRVKVV